MATQQIFPVPCLVCGNPADSNEHYIPRWLSKASNQTNATIIRGAMENGFVTGSQEHGTAVEAFEKNLCGACNNGLGIALEDPVSQILKPLIAGDFRQVGGLDEKQRKLVTWWAVLHVIEHDFLESRLDSDPKKELLQNFREIVKGGKPIPPTDLHVHLAIAKNTEWGFFISKQLIDRQRGSVQTLGSFSWGMQAGHLIFFVARCPSGARPDLSTGWGLEIHPCAQGTHRVYEDILSFAAESKIETIPQ